MSFSVCSYHNSNEHICYMIGGVASEVLELNPPGGGGSWGCVCVGGGGGGGGLQDEKQLRALSPFALVTSNRWTWVEQHSVHQRLSEVWMFFYSSRGKQPRWNFGIHVLQGFREEAKTSLRFYTTSYGKNLTWNNPSVLIKSDSLLPSELSVPPLIVVFPGEGSPCLGCTGPTLSCQRGSVSVSSFNFLFWCHVHLGA